MINIVNHEIVENTITEIYSFYGTPIHNILTDACKGLSRDVIIIDTKGNFMLSGVKCMYVHNTTEFFTELEKIKECKQFVLIIDCITFLLDKKERIEYLKRSFNIFWDFVYENEATIMIVNHFYEHRTKDRIEYLPRLGHFWSHLVDVRIKFVKENDKLEVKNI